MGKNQVRRLKMEKYTARFENGVVVVKTTEDGIRNRLDFYNWIGTNKLGKKYGKLVEITVRPWIR